MHRFSRILSAGALLLAGCTNTAFERDTASTDAPGRGACHFPEPLHVVGMPADSSFNLGERAERFFETRCRALSQANAKLKTLRMTGHPLAIWRGPDVPMALGVRVELGGFPSGSARGLPTSVRVELRWLARRGFGSSTGPIAILGKPGMAQITRMELVAGGIDRRRLHANPAARPDIGGALGPDRDPSGGVLALVELTDERSFAAYTGRDLPNPGVKPDLPEQPNTRTPGTRTARQDPASSPNDSDTARGDADAPSSDDAPNGATGRDGGKATTIAPRRDARPAHTFAGRPVQDTRVDLASRIGWQAESGWFTAQADEPPAELRHSCAATALDNETYRDQLVDDPETDAPPVYTHEPGLYLSAWEDRANQHLVALTRVGVLRGGRGVSAPPTVLVYWNYTDPSAPPDIEVTGAARARTGQDGVLYRVYLGADAWPLRCLDVVFTTKKPIRTVYGQLYYDAGDGLEAVPFRPTHVDG